jgi:hypothetical protein
MIVNAGVVCRSDAQQFPGLLILPSSMSAYEVYPKMGDHARRIETTRPADKSDGHMQEVRSLAQVYSQEQRGGRESGSLVDGLPHSV